MNSAHWHLLLNHIPVLGVWFGIAWLLAATALRNPQMIRGSWITFVVCAAVAIPVYLTGEPTEEIVEHLPAVAENIIEQHEGAGKIALIEIEILGTLSLLSLAITWRQEKRMRPLSFLSFGVALLCGGQMGYTANLGGQIRHSEIRNNGTVGNTRSSTKDQIGKRQENDED